MGSEDDDVPSLLNLEKSSGTTSIPRSSSGMKRKSVGDDLVLSKDNSDPTPPLIPDRVSIVSNKIPSPDPSLPETNKVPSPDPSLPAYKIPSPEPSLPAYKIPTPNPSLPENNKMQSRDPSLPANKLPSRDPSLPVNKMQSRDPSLPANKISHPEPSLKSYKRPSPKPSLPVNKMPSPNPSVPISYKMPPADPSLSVSYKRPSPNPSFPVSSKMASPEPSFPVNNKMPSADPSLKMSYKKPSPDPDPSYGSCEERTSSGQCVKNITLGEPEKDQLKDVGKHLLKIGQQLLDEMNFVEALLRQGMGFAKPVDSCNKSVCGPELPPEADVARSKLVQAIAIQSKRLGWIEQATEEYKSTTKRAQFGSAFGSPITSNNQISSIIAENQKVQDAQNQELKRRMFTVEAKMEKMTEAIRMCEKNIMDTNMNVQGTLTKMKEDIAILHNMMREGSSEAQSAQSSNDERIATFEAQIARMGHLLWELKCETRAQMHFGSY